MGSEKNAPVFCMNVLNVHRVLYEDEDNVAVFPEAVCLFGF